MFSKQIRRVCDRVYTRGRIRGSRSVAPAQHAVLIAGYRPRQQPADGREPGHLGVVDVALFFEDHLFTRLGVDLQRDQVVIIRVVPEAKPRERGIRQWA